MKNFRFRAKVLANRFYGFHGMVDSRFAGLDTYETTIDVWSISWNEDEIDYVSDKEGNEYYPSDGSLISIELINE